MAITSYTINPSSGAPVYYGGATILVQNPQININFLFNPDRGIIFTRISGVVPDYYQVLNNRYIIPPSGWNAEP